MPADILFRARPAWGGESAVRLAVGLPMPTPALALTPDSAWRQGDMRLLRTDGLTDVAREWECEVTCGLSTPTQRVN